jgi:hypothetical protein
MINRNDLDDYFMKSYFIENIGNVYPVNIFNYDRFSLLAGKYITQGITTLHNLYKVPKTVNVLDYFIEMALKMYNEIAHLASVQNIIPENEEQKNKLNESLTIEGVLLTKLDNRNLFGYKIVDKVKELFPTKTFKTIISKSSHLQEAPMHGKSVLKTAYHSRASKEYRDLAQEIINSNISEV